MSKIFVIWDGGYSDKSIEGAFSTYEKAESFLRRFFPDTGNVNRDIHEFDLDPFDDTDWPPGRSWLITVRPVPPQRPSFRGHQLVDGDPIVLRPEQCKREWLIESDGTLRARFWGTDVEAKAFGDAKLVEAQAKLPPGALGQSYVGRKT